MTSSSPLTREFLYQKLSVEGLMQRQVAALAGCCQALVSRKAKKFGIQPGLNHRLKFSTSEGYFSRWSPAMAYILGFAIADGYIYERKNALRFELSTRDEHVLEYIRDELSPDNVIRRRQRNDNRTGRTYATSVLSVCSRRMCDDLATLGVVPRKSGIEYMPKVPSEFGSHFLRGLFDGDGCIYIGHQPGYPNELRACFSICSSSSALLHQVRSGLGSEFGYVTKSKNHFVWTVASLRDVAELGRVMYGELGFSLARKRVKFDIVNNYLIR